MNKKYIVRLTDEERAVCEATIKKEKGKSEKLRRATILLKADADGPAWDDAKISEAIGCRTRTVENVRQAFVLEGFEGALIRKKRATSPTPKLLDGAAGPSPGGNPRAVRRTGRYWPSPSVHIRNRPAPDAPWSPGSALASRR